MRSGCEGGASRRETPAPSGSKAEADTVEGRSQKQTVTGVLAGPRAPVLSAPSVELFI